MPRTKTTKPKAIKQPAPYEQIRERTKDFLTRDSAALFAPFPNSPQELAYKSPADEVFFGGAAGGGKSAAIVGLALTRHKYSLLLRRQATQSVELVDQLKRFAGPNASWRGLGYGGVMTTEDARTVEIGGVDHEDSKDAYAGRPHDLIAFDEASAFTRSQFQFIVAWCRSSDPKQRCRVVLTGNPPTDSQGRWVVEEFAPWLDSEYPNPAKPGELRWYTTLNGSMVWLDSGEPFTHKGELIKPKSRTFIPAKLADNPILSATDYGSRLQSLPEPLRSQLLYGDFGAGMEDNAWQVIPTEWVRAAQARWKPEPPPGPQSALGVDVARGGRDATVISARYGSWFAKLEKHPGKSTPDGPAVAALAIRSHRGTAVVNIDIINCGGSAYDFLREQKWLNVVPVNNAGSGKAYRDKSGRLKFANVRAASYWKLREDLDPDSGRRLALPPDNELLADLTAPRYSVQSAGIQIEAKDDIKKRIGRSPDCGDALVLANWEPRRQVGSLYTFSGGRKHKTLKVVVCSEEELPTVEIAGPSLLIAIDDPGKPLEPLPGHALTALAGSQALRFADVIPSENRETWGEPLPPWDKPVSELVMSREQARMMWGCLLREREQRIEAIVIADQGDRRAYSVACGIADALGVPRGEMIYEVADPDSKPGEPGNPHVYSVMKTARTDLRN